VTLKTAWSNDTKHSASPSHK